MFGLWPWPGFPPNGSSVTSGGMCRHAKAMITATTQLLYRNGVTGLTRESMDEDYVEAPMTEKLKLELEYVR